MPRVLRSLVFLKSVSGFCCNGSALCLLLQLLLLLLSRFSRVRLLATPWTAAHQAPPSMGFARQEYWSGVPLLLQSAVYLAEKSYDTDPRERKSFGLLSYHPNNKITNEGHTSTSFQIHCL